MEPTSSADQSTVRKTNLNLVQAELFAAGGGLSRAELAERTGLTRATVSRLVKELLDSDIIVEAEPVSRSNRGRKGVPLFPSSGLIVGVGLEVNVDHVAGLAVDLTGVEIDRFVVEVDGFDSDPAQIMSVVAGEVAKMFVRLRERGVLEISGVTLAVPGTVDSENSEVIFAPNLNWRHVRPEELLRGAIAGVSFEVDNDANLQAISVAAALSQSVLKPETFLYVSGDVGIGGAILNSGIINRGDHGWAGEIGHLTIEPDGPECHCGSRGCLEKYAGWEAIRLAAGAPPTMSSSQLLIELEAGHSGVVSAIDRAGWALGIAIANVVKLVDVYTVVLGTGLSKLVPGLMPSMERQLDLRLLGATSADLDVLAAPDEDYPSARGGALNALQLRLGQPSVR